MLSLVFAALGALANLARAAWAMLMPKPSPEEAIEQKSHAIAQAAVDRPTDQAVESALDEGKF
jgi:hypothetical protein